MESAKFALLAVSDKLCICDISTKLNRISYRTTVLRWRIGGLKQLKGMAHLVVEAREGD